MADRVRGGCGMRRQHDGCQTNPPQTRFGTGVLGTELTCRVYMYVVAN